MRTLLSILLVVVVGLSAALPARADVTAQLHRALHERVTVWRRPDGARVYVSHCRQVIGGCESRVAAFAQMIFEAAERHGIDPFVLAAIAMRESALDPGAIGATGEAGIVQLHPRGVGARVRFVNDAQYRSLCVRRPAACQGPVLDRGAELLARCVAQCGTLEAGLGMYNSGECDPRRAYVRRVLSEASALHALVNDDAAIEPQPVPLPLAPTSGPPTIELTAVRPAPAPRPTPNR